MMSTMYLNRSLAVGALSAGLALMVGCERPPVDAEQQGPRGIGMEDLENPRMAEKAASMHEAPESAEPVSSEGPTAGEVYQNVEVLDELSVAEFTRLMQSMTEWVAPEQGCTYCHDGNDFASEDLYTYQVSRQMIEMNRYMNANWDSHLADTGVTCYTCHRGQNQPEETWFTDAEAGEDKSPMGLGNRMMQNKPADDAELGFRERELVGAGFTSLPRDAFNRYLVGTEEIAVEGDTALPTGEWEKSLQATEGTYSLMMHISDALGTNCTTCHKTGRMGRWEESPEEREISWYGIRLTRDANVNWMKPLEEDHPAARLGPTGDIAKVNCTTCHMGERLPLNGEDMVEDYPGLVGEEDKSFDPLQFGDLGTAGLRSSSAE